MENNNTGTFPGTNNNNNSNILEIHLRQILGSNELTDGCVPGESDKELGSYNS
jgi:hypothetical protein